MKSFFLLSVILGALTTTQVIGQTKTVTTTAPAETAAAEAQKSDFDKFYERLSISYFGAVTSPNLEDWDSRYGAVSPEFAGKKCRTCDSYAFNVWSQVNFAYNFGAKMKFNIIPRWTTFFDEAPDQSKDERGNILFEDALIGFSGVVYSSTDKKLNLWIRPGLRLPTSHATRHSNQTDRVAKPASGSDPAVTRLEGVGRLNYNIEMLGSLTYDFTPKFQVGLSYQDRTWIYENRFNDTRRRMYINPNVTFTLNDTTKIQAHYETMLENTRRRESINGLKPSYRNVWQNAYIGVAKDITPKLNVYPYVAAFVNDVPFSMTSAWLGMWVSYSIK